MAAPYFLGAGDRLQVTVWQEDDLTGIYTISKDGYLTVNWMEPILVKDKTLDEAKVLVQKTVSEYVRKPVVTLSVADYQSKKITILGEVKIPGLVFLKNDQTLIHVILKDAGGVTGQAGDTLSVVRAHTNDKENFETVTVSLGKLLSGDPTQNITLRDGDTLLVPRYDSKGVGSATSDSVFVVGEVKNKGSFRIKEGYTVLNAVLDAGGFTKFASQNRVKVVRGQGETKKEFIVRMKDVMEDGEKSKDLAVEPGDLIIVPRSII